MKKITYIAIVLLFIFNYTFAQKTESYKNAQKYLDSKGEVIIRFKAASEAQFEELNKIISVDHKQVDKSNLEVEAYVTREQFKKFLTFGLEYQVKISDNETQIEPSSINRKTTGTWDTTWDAYPKYSEYVAKMQYWATTYPSLCTLQNIGSTPNGRALYVLKISDNAAADESEPEFLYTSSMHGDEITGYPNMLHLIDYLLTNYGSNSEVTNIVNGTEIYICPLANPDGSYKSIGNDTYNSSGNAATRANANSYDLNRNYPDPLNGLHPDSGLQTNPVYQPETAAFMAFERTRNFVLAANFHGGAQVVNFPWDTYPTPTANIHPHDNYFKYVSKEFASLAQTASGNNGYMTDAYGTGQFPGTTNGSAWYTISGGRQDYNNYCNHSKEVTIEVSVIKTPLASDLPTFWTYLKQSLLNYIKQASYGVQGTVTDASGNPIHAKVYVSGTQDGFGAWVETSPTVGDYHKVQIAGTYSLIFEAPGYTSQTISATIVNGVATTLNVVMIPTTAIPIALDQTICYGKTANLTATGSGTINWYTSANATTPVATGSSYPTPALNTTTSYYVEDVVTPANLGPTTASGTKTSATAGKYLIFNCSSPTKLKSVLINNSAVGQLLVELQDNTGKMLESKVVLLTTIASQDIDLDFFLPVATGLRLVARQLSYTNLTYSSTGITYPITSGNISITGNSGSGTWFQFYNWKFASIKSNRDEVIVTVKPNPTISSISPSTKIMGSPNFTLTVTGTNFVNGESVIRWNGVNRTTNFMSATQLTSTITAAEIATAGTVNVSVYNTCNLTNSSNQTFTITCTVPVANVTSLPDSTGQCAATLTAPTATSACYGQITGTTSTIFPVTSPGTTIVTWTYNDGNGQSVTQNQNVIISSTTWNGTAWSNGIPASGKGAIISGNFTATANLTACSLTVNNNAVVTVNSGINLDIYGDISVSTGSSLTFENNTNLVQTKTTNGNTGNIIVKRQTSALMRQDYVMWTAPVAGQQLLSFSPATLATRFYTYNPTSNLYAVVSSPSTTSFALGTGYLIRMPNTHPTTPTIWEGQFQGVPNNGTIDLTGYTSGTYNAIGNPYPSTLNADTFRSVNGITEALYFWRKTNNTTSSSYATYTLAGGTANTGGGSNIVPNNIIQVGQGFIAKVTAGTIHYTNLMRLANNGNQFLKTKAIERDRIWLNLSAGTSPVNQMMVAYMDGATSGIDDAIDGRYINDNPTALNSNINDEEFVIQGKGLPFDVNDIVPLTFKTNVSGDFTIAIDHFDGLFSTGQDIFLKDNTTGLDYDLKAADYTFTSAIGTFNNRFQLTYKSSTALGVNNPDFVSNIILVYMQNGVININAGKTIIKNVKVFDIRGSMILEQKNVNSTTASLKNLMSAKQTLLIQITSEEGKIVTKKVIY